MSNVLTLEWTKKLYTKKTISHAEKNMEKKCLKLSSIEIYKGVKQTLCKLRGGYEYNNFSGYVDS